MKIVDGDGREHPGLRFVFGPGPENDLREDT
jgi:hypothetical protein